MTRPDQKQAERQTLNTVLAACGLRPDREPEEGEAPDFTMPVCGKTIGVEITMYRSGATVEGGMECRQVESEWDILQRGSEIFRGQRPELARINVGLMFRGAVPPRKQHGEFMMEIVAFVREHAAELMAEDRVYWPQDFSTPLMREYLSALHLRTDEFAVWHSNLAGGFVARPDATIAEIVAEKSGKTFRPTDELWLVIQPSTRISEMVLDIMGVEDFASVPSLEPYGFSRVFLLAYTGAYEWRRGAGWRKLTGDNPRGEGPTLDELKAVLRDPEWLADPDAKAMQVAAECLREMERDRNPERPPGDDGMRAVNSRAIGESRANPASWIGDGEKYALVGLSVRLEGPIPKGQVAPGLWVLADAKFDIPAHWRECLGTIRAEEVEDCNLLLISKQPSSLPEVLDAENQRLQQRVSNFYVGLLLASTFSAAHKPVMLSGARRGNEIDIRQQHDFDAPVPSIFRPYPPVLDADIQLAARLAGQIEALGATALAGGHCRLFRTLGIYRDARTVPDILDRLQQYARCIDGLILPDVGKTKQQFKSRTELFIGPRYHELMGEIYDVRSAVEHLHDNRYLEGFDRETRLDLIKKEAVIEHIARTALTWIIGNSRLWPHFANTESLASFWALPEDERRPIWGDPIDPLKAVADFDPRYIHDGLLGKP